MLKWIAQKWAASDPLPKEVNLIAVISYTAANKTSLTNGSRKIVELAKSIAEKYPEALVGWCSSGKNEQIEREVKMSVFPESIYAGVATSSTDECEAILMAVTITGRPIRKIVVVAEGSHSRRCKLVWEYYFPNIEICSQSIPAWEAADRENPAWTQRSWRGWLLVNVVLYPFFRWWPGVAWFAKRSFHQPGY